MSTGYELAGRVHQKQRTREALLIAARALVAAGVTPTVELAAEQARVSRTTAYRYFSNQAELLAAAHPEIITTTVLPDQAPTSVDDRLEIVVTHITNLVRETESQQRTMLRLSLDPDRQGRDELLLRQGRVIRWLEDALAPLNEELGPDVVHALAVAIRSSIGIESYVWLVDVAHLPPDHAVELMHWTARSLLDGARRGSLPPVPADDDQLRRRSTVARGSC